VGVGVNVVSHVLIEHLLRAEHEADLEAEREAALEGDRRGGTDFTRDRR
jgi:hypothetical protein